MVPFYGIMRVERINSQNFTLSITVRHKIKLLFQFTIDRFVSDVFCDALRLRLQAHVDSMKKLKTFLSECPSEALLAGQDVKLVGLGAKYGYIESKKAVEKSKLRFWISYFREFGCNLTLIRFPTFLKLIIRFGLPDSLRGELWEVCSGSMYKRFMSQGYYEKLHIDNAGRTSLSTEEIEKDLNRYFSY